MTLPAQTTAGTAGTAMPTATVTLPNGATNANGQLVLVCSFMLYQLTPHPWSNNPRAGGVTLTTFNLKTNH